jgi:hypothetical protein
MYLGKEGDCGDYTDVLDILEGYSKSGMDLSVYRSICLWIYLSIDLSVY